MSDSCELTLVMQVLNIGVVYKAEPGEGLAALAARFGMGSSGNLLKVPVEAQA